MDALVARRHEGRRARALDRPLLRAGQLREDRRDCGAGEGRRRSGGVYSSHIRDEADYTIGVVAAVDEVIRIAEEAHIRAVVSHMKALGPANWGKSVQLVERIERARARGLEVFADQYAYEASGTSIVAALIPRWAEAGGRPAMLERVNGDRRGRACAPQSPRTSRDAAAPRSSSSRTTRPITR